MNRAALIERDLEEFLHKLLDVLLVNPGRAKAYINLGGIQILGLRLFQRLHDEAGALHRLHTVGGGHVHRASRSF